MPTKVFEQGPDLIQGSPFTIYTGLDCPAVGMDDTKALARARARLDYARGPMIDQHIAEMIEAEGTPITGDTLADVLMAFETLAAQEFGGYATILLTKALTMCAYAEELILLAPNGGLMTINGTKVANIHPVAIPNARNAFLAGRIILLEGPVTGRVAHEMSNNAGTICYPRRALAEQVIVPLIECAMYSATATCPLSTP